MAHFPDSTLIARLSEYHRRRALRCSLCGRSLEAASGNPGELLCPRCGRAGEQAETFAELERRARTRVTPDLQGRRMYTRYTRN